MLHVGGTKSMTEKITEGLAQGKGKKDRESFNKYLYNQSISFIKTAGFFDLWGVLAVCLIAMDGAGLTLPVNLQGCWFGIFLLYLRIYGLIYIVLSLHPQFSAIRLLHFVLVAVNP